jgi:hypothetical protein
VAQKSVFFFFNAETASDNQAVRHSILVTTTKKKVEQQMRTCGNVCLPQDIRAEIMPEWVLPGQQAQRRTLYEITKKATFQRCVLFAHVCLLCRQTCNAMQIEWL